MSQIVRLLTSSLRSEFSSLRSELSSLIPPTAEAVVDYLTGSDLAARMPFDVMCIMPPERPP